MTDPYEYVISDLQAQLEHMTRQRDGYKTEWDVEKKRVGDLIDARTLLLLEALKDKERLAAVVAEANRLVAGASAVLDRQNRIGFDIDYSEGILHAAERLRDKAAGL